MSQAGWVWSTPANGEAANKKKGSTVLHLVISNISMPGINSIQEHHEHKNGSDHQNRWRRWFSYTRLLIPQGKTALINFMAAILFLVLQKFGGVSLNHLGNTIPSCWKKTKKKQGKFATEASSQQTPGKGRLDSPWKDGRKKTAYLSCLLEEPAMELERQSMCRWNFLFEKNCLLW